MPEYVTPVLRVPNGTHSYCKVLPYGPALSVTLTIYGACLFSNLVGEGADMAECSGYYRYEIQASAVLELAWHLRCRQAIHHPEAVAA